MEAPDLASYLWIEERELEAGGAELVSSLAWVSNRQRAHETDAVSSGVSEHADDDLPGLGGIRRPRFAEVREGGDALAGAPPPRRRARILTRWRTSPPM